MKGIFEILARSGSILMFPEGTRSRTGELRPLKPGLGYAAVSSGVAIAPVYVTGTNDLGRCLLRRRRLRVVIGPPIRLRADRIGEDRKREYRILTAMAASELEMLRDEARD
jgi:1-acyl-sn-glycerol-3-phosphate acyltransferase